MPETTHLLKCRHQIGANGFDYTMPCNILKKIPGGRLKIEVFGDRYWKDNSGKRSVRYVYCFRVKKK